MEERHDCEFVIAPWDTDTSDTEIVTVELPSRNIVAQVEVPAYILENNTQLSQQHEIPFEDILAERLEINKARLHVMIAETGASVKRTRENLEKARQTLTGVEHIDTTDVEQQIETVWLRELDST